MWGREEQQTLTDIRVVLLSGLIGAVLSAVVALFIAQRQQAKQRRQEKWVRVLNGYQDFYTEGQKYLTFLALDQQELARDALKAVYKQFEADKATARWASKPDRRPRHPF